MRRSHVPLIVAVLALVAIAVAVWRLQQAADGIRREAVSFGTIPAIIYHPVGVDRAPVVVIAHGFAGSQQLMQSFALALARNGYMAVTFDFAGHGRNPSPMTGDVTRVSGTTRMLLAEVRRVVDAARPLGDGRVALLGHSMASDIVVRAAEETPGIDATIAVSMFSPAVTATRPPNLLVIAGDWETTLKTEALRAVGLATAPAAPRAGVTYGTFADGTARRAAFSAGVEHVGVLFSRDSLREAIAWLDQAFAISRAAPPRVDARGPAIALVIFGAAALAWPLSRLLPRLVDPPAGAGLAWRALLPRLLAPMLATPLLLRLLPTHFLPVVVGDYLAVHFLVYGLLTIACLAWPRRRPPAAPPPSLPVSRRLTAAATAALIAFFLVGMVWPINATFTSFLPSPQRLVLIAIMSVGTLAYFVSDEWLVRGAGAARGAYVASKIAFLVSLAMAVALDFERLLFLLLIVPLMALFFIVHGLFSHWCYRQTGQPLVAGLANAFACAWAIGVTFPLLAG